MKKEYKNLLMIAGGVFIGLSIIFRKPLGQAGKKIMDYFGFTKEQKYPILMNAILKGESKGYNDYNYPSKNCRGGYCSFFYGKTKTGTQTKKLTDMTIAEVMQQQAAFKLHATGRYQIITPTLKAMVIATKINTNLKYNEENQDKLGTALIDVKRSFVSKYVNSKIPDTAKNLIDAVFQIAQEWSSVADPRKSGGLSYYAGDGTHYAAPTSVEEAKTALRQQRAALA